MKTAGEAMGASPTVSVIIPTYNSRRFLEVAIDSVEAQTYRDFEIIVVDDGSTDDTAEWAERNAGRLHYYHQENARQAVARNRGAELARGKYLAFLDADDLWLPEKLDIQVELAERHPEASFVFSDGYRVQSEADYQHIVVSLGEAPSLTSLYTHPPNPLTFDFEFRMHCVPTSSIFVSRELFHKVGGMPNSSPAEDYALCCMLLLRSPAIFVDRPLMVYRSHSENTSSAVKGRKQALFTLMMKDRARLLVSALAHSHGNCPAVAANYANFSLPFRLLLLLFWRVRYGSSLQKIGLDLARVSGACFKSKKEV